MTGLGVPDCPLNEVSPVHCMREMQVRGFVQADANWVEVQAVHRITSYNVCYTKLLRETLKANGLKAAYIRPLVFIGEGAMGVFPGKNPIRVAIATWHWGAYLGEEALKKGIRISYNFV